MVRGRESLRVYDAGDRDWLREVRWRRDDAPAPHQRRVLLAVLLAHLVLVLVVRDAMFVDVPAPVAAPKEQVLEVVFGTPADPTRAMSALETLPLPQTEPVREVVVPVRAREPLVAPPPSRVQAAPVVRVEPTVAPTDDSAMSARFIEPEPPKETTPLRLFNSDGSVHVSTEMLEAIDSKPQPGYSPPAVKQPELMRHESPVSYTPTRFDRYWAPPNETILQEFFRKSTVEKKFKTPWGTTVQCAWMLFMGGCGWGAGPTPLKNPPKGPEVLGVYMGPEEPPKGPEERPGG